VTDHGPTPPVDLDAAGLRVLADAALVLLGRDIAGFLGDLAAARDRAEQSAAGLSVAEDRDRGCEDRAVSAAGSALDLFQQQRPRLVGIAYRMLGSATDAEDVLQDAWLRWSGVDVAAVADPGAYLARTVTNLCLNALDSARVRREVYVGPWLPEPVLTGPGSELGPLEDAVQRESVAFALLVLLERLTPTERAAYVLCEAFGYSSREAGELIGTTDANVRQLLTRARKHVGRAPAQPVDEVQWRSLVERFLGAARDGDVAGLAELLTVGVTVRSDGGGRVTAARNPVRGRDKVVRYVVGVVDRFAVDMMPGVVEVNGAPAVVATVGGTLQGVWFVHTDGERVTGVDAVLNPDKLAAVAAQLSRIRKLSGL
jgi:RNA polymerase sigma-70 factor (ECF subfamily)